MIDKNALFDEGSLKNLPLYVKKKMKELSAVSDQLSAKGNDNIISTDS
ncbi:hypothetical protein ACFL6W_01085 [Thermodesulfobacteriota bacterium]